MEIRERDYYWGLLIRNPLQLHMGHLSEFGVNLAFVLHSKSSKLYNAICRGKQIKTVHLPCSVWQRQNPHLWFLVVI